ncbi:MAG TPA: NUDIX domain-containing protein [Burkholderiales bacterium]|nr:NUDIX domain-containing protein [Burkholderiales bacterium]
MAQRTSAGILLYRIRSGQLQVFIVHPGGPFWARKDAGAWSIPKGEIEQGSDPLETAKREFHEETGKPVSGEFLPLTPLKQRSGKVVHAWAVNGDIDPATIKSNTFTMEWPPGSGKRREFPEIDRGGWFAIAEATERLLPGQLGFLAELQEKLGPTPLGIEV